MLVLCKDKKPEDLVKYGFVADYPTNSIREGKFFKNEIISYKLMTKSKRNTKYSKKGEPVTLLSYYMRNNSFDWNRTFYSDEIQKIVYILIKDNIIEYQEPFDKDEKIAKLEAKIQEYKDKIKELEEN